MLSRPPSRARRKARRSARPSPREPAQRARRAASRSASCHRCVVARVAWSVGSHARGCGGETKGCEEANAGRKRQAPGTLRARHSPTTAPPRTPPAPTPPGGHADTALSAAATRPWCAKRASRHRRRSADLGTVSTNAKLNRTLPSALPKLVPNALSPSVESSSSRSPPPLAPPVPLPSSSPPRCDAVSTHATIHSRQIATSSTKLPFCTAMLSSRLRKLSGAISASVSAKPAETTHASAPNGESE